MARQFCGITDLPFSFAQSTYDAIVNNIYTSQKGNYTQKYIDDEM